jgi:two-component system sporulation sensor kinase C
MPTDAETTVTSEIERLRRRVAELELRIAAGVDRQRVEEALRDLDFRFRAVAGMGILLARVAHEINNPLAGIKNAFALVKDAIPKGTEDYEFVQLIDREIDRIAGTVRQLYEFCGDRSRGPSQVDVRDIIRGVMRSIAPLADAREVTLRAENEADAPRDSLEVCLPENDLCQALVNVATNAIEASQPGGEVVIQAVRQGDAVRVVVRDRGAGIAPTTLDRIFEPFFSTKEAAQAASGLGLSVARNLIALMGGRIDVDSDVGRGSTFSIVLPQRVPC